MVTRICRQLVDAFSRMLTPDERDAVLGDLAERGANGGQALRDVLGLVLRRQAALWKHWRPWAALVGLALPLSVPLSIYSRRVADAGALYIWLYANNWDWSLLRIHAFWPYAPAYIARVLLSNFTLPFLLSFVTLPCWSWNIGLALGNCSRRAIPVTGSLFCLMLLAELAGMSRIFDALGRPPEFASSRDYTRQRGGVCRGVLSGGLSADGAERLW